MKKMQSGLFGSLIIVMIVTFLSGTAFSQSDTTNQKMEKQTTTTRSIKYDKDVMDAASNLKIQVDLTAEQTKRIEGILQKYKDSNSSSDKTSENNNMSSENNNSMSSSNNSTLNKIEKVLTSEQKTKFDQIKDQWWSETQKSLSNSTTTDKPKSGY